MASPKRPAEKPSTSSSSEHVEFDDDGGMGQDMTASIAAIGEELRRSALSKQQRPDGDGGSAGTDSGRCSVAPPPRKPWSLLPGMGSSFKCCSNPVGCPFTAPTSISTPLSTESTWSGGPFGTDSFPGASAVGRPPTAPRAPPRQPTSSTAPDRDLCASLGHRYLTIRRGAYVYQTEDWQPMSMTLYIPLEQDIMINTRTINQLSYESNYFFIGDSYGNYRGTKSGNAVHLWRLDFTTKKLYIAQSILFIRDQDFKHVVELVKNL